MMGDIDRKIVEGWDSSRSAWGNSEREYAEVSGVQGIETVGDYRRYSETRYPPLYLDPKTGLVVHDVFAYEAWLKTLETKPIPEPMPDEEPHW